MKLLTDPNIQHVQACDCGTTGHILESSAYRECKDQRSPSANRDHAMICDIKDPLSAKVINGLWPSHPLAETLKPGTWYRDRPYPHMRMQSMSLRTDLEPHGPVGLHEMAIAWTGRVRGEAIGRAE